MKTFFLILFFFANLLTIKAQELNCNVIINSDRVETQERQILTQMKSAIQEFMNTTRWTSDTFNEKERIKCSIFFNLDGVSNVGQGKYEATVQIQSVRPIYGTDYESPVLIFFDRKFIFEYLPSQPLIFTENAYTTNLTATLAFYAYTMIALDYDTFAKHGGAPFYERLLNISNNSQQAGSAGWNNSDTRNRYWISENLTSPQALPLREALYIYHRLVLDDFLNNTDEKRLKVIDCLEKIKQFHVLRPFSVMINAFFDAKVEELVNIFSQGDMGVREKAVALMSEMNAPNASKYQKILEQ